MHAMNADLLTLTKDYFLRQSGSVAVIDGENILRYVCEEGDLTTDDLTAVADHVTLHQFVVKPEPLVRVRKDTRDAHQYGNR